MMVNGEKFSKRDKVVLNINALDASAIQGDYSISIRKTENLIPFQPNGAEEFMAALSLEKRNPTIPESLVFLPEPRGELISGKVAHKEGTVSVEGRTVVLSLPGDDFVLDMAMTNREGIFYFNLDAPFGSSNAIFQVLGEDRDSFSISMDKHISPDYGALSPSAFQLKKEFGELIMERSIHHQIENAYREVKSDSLLPYTQPSPFYWNAPLSYNLDDYTRFNGIDETIVEIVDHVWMRTNDHGKRVFQVRPEEGNPDLGILPLVLVDGIMVQDHEGLLGHGAKKIQSIGIDRKTYMIGPATFQGILSFQTVLGDFNKHYSKDYLTRDTLFKPEAIKRYHLQNGVETAAKIPDFRYQLYWNPHFVQETPETTIEFYTSDISGIFEINLEGFTQNGAAVSLRTFFTVE
jgi:hypothetical protein